MTSGQMMRALAFERPAVDARATRVRQMRVPVPGRGQLSIDVQYAGVNFKDVMARRGDAGYVSAWPFIPGVEVSGTVRELGADVGSFEVGQPVVALTNAGGLAEVAIADAAVTAAIPDPVELRRAAAAPGALISAVLLLDTVGRVRAGDTVLVHSAAGAVGRAAAQVARRHGVARLVGSVGDPRRVAPAEQAGYDAVIVRFRDLATRVRRHAPAGVDLVLDPQGTSFLDQDLDALAPGGRVILFGNADGTPLAALPPAGRLFAGNAAVGGFSLESMSRQAPHLVVDALTTVLDDLAARRLDVEITEISGLDDAAAAQQALADGTGTGKYVVRVTRP